jgi:hypothetical protein
VSDVNAGTGNYNSFLRLQKHGRERGFNTDDDKEADNKDGIWTHSLKFSDMQALIDPDTGIEYYEIRLDLNEGNAEGDPPIILKDLRFFYSSFKATGTDYDNDFVNLHEVFDLIGQLNLEDVHTGSGSDDYVFKIPTSLFPDKTGYFTLYSDFDGADGGFEEWRVLANEIGDDGLPGIHLEKTANPTHFNEGSATDVTFTYVLTSQSSSTDPLTLTSFVDDNATPGDPSDDINLLLNASGTYLGDYYVSGDTNNDGLLQNTETWTFSVTITGLKYNAGTTRTNTAEVFARDDEGNQVDDADDAVVTADDVLPLITLVKDANYTLIDEGTPTDITYSYTLTSQSADTDPLTVTSLIDDMGTVDTGDDIELITGVDPAHKLGIYYVSGDTNNDQLLQNTETWLFNYTVNDVVLNAGETRTNIGTVAAQDDEGNPAGDTDDHTVTGQDVDPTLNIDKVASVTQVQAGKDTSVTFTYTLTNTSPASTDPITITHLVDDMGTADTGDDVILFDGDSTLGKGIYYDSGDDGDGLLELGESWVYKFTTNVTLDAGETRTNIVTVDGHDDEDNDVSDTDDASITAYNLGRTPGFWSNEKNGGKLWDGNDNTWPNGGNLGTTSFLGANKDLLYTIHDLNTDGDGIDTGEATGRRDMIMVGDWDHDGIADANENVLLMTRTDAMSLLNSSEKQQQDGRYMLARDLVASWLNYLAGSYVGDPNNATPNSVVRYVDAAVAWLQQTTDGNQIFLKSELTSGTKVGTSTAKWTTGIDLDDLGTAVNPGIPAAGQHDFVIAGANNDIDILGGGTLHTGLDHYNNFGFI